MGKSIDNHCDRHNEDVSYVFQQHTHPALILYILTSLYLCCLTEFTIDLGLF